MYNVYNIIIVLCTQIKYLIFIGNQLISIHRYNTNVKHTY